MAGIVITKDFAAPVFVTLALSFQYFIITMVVPMRARAKNFPYHWLKANFGEDHQEAFGTKIPDSGYPDIGDGRYSKKLSYAQWLEVMAAQRTALNYLEQLPLILFSTIVSGFEYPIVAASLGAAYFLGRVLYTIGFTSKYGVSARFPGFAIAMLSLVA